jgi:hypothetical protein
LKGRQIPLCLRKKEFIQVEEGIWQALDSLGLKPGISLCCPIAK